MYHCPNRLGSLQNRAQSSNSERIQRVLGDTPRALWRMWVFAHPLAHACLQDHRPTGYEVQLDTGQGGGHLWDSYRKIRRSHMPRKLVFQEPRYLPNDWYRREFLKLLCLRLTVWIFHFTSCPTCTHAPSEWCLSDSGVFCSVLCHRRFLPHPQNDFMTPSQVSTQFEQERSESEATGLQRRR